MYEKIRAALETELYGVSGLPDIAPENVSYTPKTDKAFIKPHFVPVSRRPAVRGTDPQQRYDGLYRIYCHTPEGSGTFQSNQIVETLLTHFDATTDIEYEDIYVSIDYADRNEGRVVGGWYQVVVDISWYSYG